MENFMDSLPIYVRIAEGIKDHILSGDLKEGEQVVSTTQVSNEYNISIATVNKGINLLRNVRSGGCGQPSDRGAPSGLQGALCQEPARRGKAAALFVRGASGDRCRGLSERAERGAVIPQKRKSSGRPPSGGLFLHI